MRHEWLLDDKYNNWVTKERSDDQTLVRFKQLRCVLTAAKSDVIYAFYNFT